MEKRAISVFLFLLILFSFLPRLTAAAPTAPTLQVKNGNDDGPDSLRDVIAHASDGDTITFAPEVDSVILRGGEIVFHQRNLTIDGGAGTIRIYGWTGDFRLLHSTAATGTLTLRGLTLSNGNAPVGSEKGWGGGLLIDGDAALINCALISNTAVNGGGLAVNGTATLADCLFRENAASADGGGLYAGADAELNRCGFVENTAVSGGGAYMAGAARLETCAFEDNAASGSGGGLRVRNTASLNGCAFEGNEARSGPGGALLAFASDLLIMTNCTVEENITRDTTSCSIDCAANTYIIHSTIVSNMGGGICADAANANLFNCIVTGNTNAAGTAPRQVEGTVKGTGNLIENGTTVTHAQIFGANAFGERIGSTSLLSNGIAVNASSAITSVSGSGLTSFHRETILDALAKDQVGAARPTSGSVTCGAVQAGQNTLAAIEVSTQPTKTHYDLNETSVDLTGAMLRLIYSNGGELIVPYTESGVSHNKSEMEQTLHLEGNREITFAFLGRETLSGKGARFVVGRENTAITVIANKNATVYGEVVTFTATLTPGTATGTVEFFCNGLKCGESALNVFGTATCNLSDLPSGDHDITAKYAGDALHIGATSEPFVHTVEKANTAVTVTDISSVKSGSGESLTITARLSVTAPGADTLVGKTLTFYDGTTLLGNGICDASGLAVLTTAAFPLGQTLQLSAQFAGDDNLSGSVSATQSHTTGAEKATGTTVSAPALDSKTTGSITLCDSPAPTNGQSVEYAIGTSPTPPATGWNPDPVFTDLDEYSVYYLFARTAENASHQAGAPSAPLMIRTGLRPANLRGDANCDGTVDASDAAAILRYLVQLRQLSLQGLANALLTGGENPTAADAARILRWLVQLLDTEL